MISVVGIVDLADRLDSPEVLQLAADTFGSPDAASRAVERYRAGEWAVLGYEENGEVIAFVGAEPLSDAAVRIRGIAVRPDRRRAGIGRHLVQALRSRNPGVTLLAETDGDALRFYERCGFRVGSLGETYPGVERFECVLPASWSD